MYDNPSSAYEALDYACEKLGAGELADYLYINYPSFAEALKHEIEARIYFDIMQSSMKGEFNGR